MRAPGLGTPLWVGGTIVTASSRRSVWLSTGWQSGCAQRAEGSRAGSHHRPMNTNAAAEPLRTSEVADPGILIEQIGREHRLTEGLVLLALVKHPSTEQSLVHVAPFPGGLVDPAPDDLN